MSAKMRTARFHDSALESILARMLDADVGTALMSEYTKQQTHGLPQDMRAEFTLNKLDKPVGSPKVKPSTRALVFQEQLKRLDDKHKQDVVIMEDIQDFVKARARLEMEFSHGLTKLSQQFLQKRKWPPYIYNEGHDNILFLDLWRCMVNLTAEDAQAHATASERLQQMASAAFDQSKEESKALFKTAFRIVASLQEELFTLDNSVAQAKRTYDTATRELLKQQKYKKKGMDIKKVEASAQFARHDYLLELACANKQYLKFRNEQLPEVMDTVSAPTIDNIKTFFHNYTDTLRAANNSSSMERLKKLSLLLAPEFQRRSFLHQHRHEFPGRQLFDMEPYPGKEGEARDLVIDHQSRSVLLQIRNLLQHSSDTLEKRLKEKEIQMESLYSLYGHYLTAGDVLGTSQCDKMREKMEALYCEMEGMALDKGKLDIKIAHITHTGIDDTPTPPGTPLSVRSQSTSGLLELGEAQEREALRRHKLSDHNEHGNGRPASSTSSTPSAQSVVNEDAQFLPERPDSMADRFLNLSQMDLTSPQTPPPPAPPPAPSVPTESPMLTQLLTRVNQLKKAGNTPPTPQNDKQRQTGSPASLMAYSSPPLPPAPTSEISGSAGPPLPPPPSANGLLLGDLPPPPPLPPLPHGVDLKFGPQRSNISMSSVTMDFSGDDDFAESDIPPFYRAIYDYKPTQGDDLSLKAGEVIYVLVVRDDGWCQGMNVDQKIGYFPQSYVTREEEQEKVELPRPRIVEVKPNGGRIGFRLAGGHPVRVDHVDAGSSALSQGVKVGDLILEINNEPCADQDAADISPLLLQGGLSGSIKLCILTR